jgi:tetratricopeptide (TPR) repeat protein
MPIVAYRILCLTAVIESQEREFALLEASPDSSTEPESKTKISILADEIYRDKCKVNQLATEIGVSTKAEVYHALSVQHYNNTLSRVPETNPQSPATRSPEDKDYEFNIATYFWQMEGINHRVAYKFAKLAKEMGCEVPQSHIDAARIKLLKYGIYLFRYGDPTEVLTIFKEAGIDGDDLNTSYYIAIHKIFLPCFQDHSYEEYQSIYNNITSYYVPLNDGAQRDFYEAYKFQVLTLGVYFYEKGDREQAANLFGEVGEGGYEEALCRLAQYHQKCGEGDKASPLLDRALASLPEPSSGDYDEDEVYDIKALVVSCMPKVLPKVLSS